MITGTFKYPKESFRCFKDAPAPPSPGGKVPAPDNKGDTHLGLFCTQASDCQVGITDDDTKKTYCCGTATGGKLVGTDGKVTALTANNAVICGKNPGVEV